MRKFYTLVLLFCLSAASASAQGSGTGRLSGVVSGPDGVIPGATVVVTDNQTQRERTVISSDEGVFAVPQLEAGTYTVTITATGFKTFRADELKIDVGREYSLNPTLAIGEISENVVVTAGADILNATSAEISNTVSPRQIQELPLNGRDPLNLIQLQPGVASNGQTNTSINGQRPSLTNITLDGINVQDQFIRESASDFSPQRQTTDTIAEFTLTSSNAGAEQGYGASHVQQVTPRGQSDFHGALFAYNRNDYFGANTFFNNAAGLPRPRRNRNQFGGAVSGPMVFPRFGEGGPALVRGRAFFFGAYEGFREPLGVSATRTVLTPEARQGFFTYTAACTNTGNNLCPAGITPGQTVRVNLFDPRLGTGVTGVNPLVQSRILDLIPAAGNAPGGDSRNTTGYRFTRRADSNRNQFVSRLDYDINDRHAANFVFRLTRSENLRPDIDTVGGFGSNLAGAGFTENPVFSNRGDNEFVVGAYRITPSPNFTNEFRAGAFLSRINFSRNEPLPPFLIEPALISNPTVGQLPQGRESNTYTLQSNGQYLRGRHAFRFGGLAQFIRNDSQSAIETVPEFALGTILNTGFTTQQFANQALFPGGVPSNQQGTANSLLALLGGLVSSSSQSFNATRETGFSPGAPTRNVLGFENYGFYVSDQWRLSPRLTVNLGLRYDIYTPVRDINGSLLEVVIPEGSNIRETLLNSNARLDFVGANGNGDKLFKTDWNNFAPNVSVAYAPQFENSLLGAIFPGGGRTVIRGGYSLTYANDEYVKGALSGANNSGLSVSRTLPYTQRFTIDNPGLPTPGVPQLQIPYTFRQRTQSLGAGSIAFQFGINPELQVASSHQYNVGIQRELGWQTALEIRYVGGFSDNLTNITNPNQYDILGNGFLEDFRRAQQNLRLSGGVSAAFNPNIAGSQQLPVFNQLGTGFGSNIPGVLNLGGIISRIRDGRAAELALVYVANGLAGNVRFQPNPDIGATYLLDNVSRYNYNSLQVELRRRFSQGLYFQGNYTFSKTLTDASGLSQLRQEPRLDENRPELDYARADYDQTHRFNFNSIYELPFGRGKRFFSDAGGWLNRLVGGFQFNTIVTLGSGSPITITDARGTFNPLDNGRQTPLSNLTGDQLRNLFGVFNTPDGVFFINPEVLQITRSATGAVNSRGALGQVNLVTLEELTFPGQVFFLNGAGGVGNVPRAIGDSPWYFNIDASLIKNIQITEGSRLQLRMEAFNALNRTNFDVNRLTQDINSNIFGQIRATFDPRIVQFAARFEF